MIAAIIYVPYSLAANNDKIIITGDVVNVREAPSTSNAVLTQVRRGDTLTVISHENGWYKIKLSTGQVGYIADWLATPSDSNSVSKTAIVQVDHLNIRSADSATSQVLGQLNTNDEIQVINQTGDWTEIVYKETTAWVSSQYIEINEKKVEPTKREENVTPPVGQSITILNNGTNIRKKPTTKAKVIAQANANHTYEVISQLNDWYEIKLENGQNGYIASWVVTRSTNYAGTGLTNKLIVIDPGHGGKDKGTTSIHGVYEKDLTIKTAERLANKLRSSGAKVILTRDSDEFISLEERTYIAARNQADIFISLHYDSIEDRSVHGHTTYYYHNYEKKLSESINEQLGKQLSLKNRGTRHGNYFVIRENQVPSMLLELGYLSNDNEAAYIQTDSYQEQVTNAIVDGLKNYFK